MRKKGEELTNRQKAAVILMCIGPEISGQVVRHMTEEQVEQLSLELARLDKVTPEQRVAITNEFYEGAAAQEFIAEGGVGHARKLLEAAFGESKAISMVDKVVEAMQVVPFEFLKKADPGQVLTFIQDEHPQT